jgi:hypothetical protein
LTGEDSFHIMNLPNEVGKREASIPEEGFGKEKREW